MRLRRYSFEQQPTRAAEPVDEGAPNHAPSPSEPPSSPSQSTAGGWVGGYYLLEPLGSGGSGTVWRAQDEGGSQVALKLLHPSLAHSDSARRRLAREARLVNQVPGPGIARVLDIETDGFSPFVVTELVEGLTLDESVRESGDGPFLDEEIVELGTALADILDRVHGAGIAHRDLKPSNVILGQDGPVLIDFGIAQGDNDARMTTTGALQGTPGYVAPELLQAAAPAFDDWVIGDWFAWAATLCFAATGRPPFGTGSAEAVLHRLFQGHTDVEGLTGAAADAFTLALMPQPGLRTPPRRLVEAIRSGAAVQQTTALAADGAWEPPADATMPLAGGESGLVEDSTAYLTRQVDSMPSPGASEATRNLAGAPDRISALQKLQGGPPVAGTPGWDASPQSVTNPDLPAWAAQASAGWAGPTEAVLPSYAHPAPRPAPWLSVLLLGVLAWLAAVTGPNWLVLGPCVLLVAQIAGRMESGVARRRNQRGGPARSDAAITALASPLSVLLATAVFLPSLILGLVVFLSVATAGQVIADVSSGSGADLAGVWRWAAQDLGANAPSSVVTGIAAWAALVAAWAIPSSRWAREGLSRWFTFTGPSRLARTLWGLGLAALLIVCVGAAVLGVT